MNKNTLVWGVFLMVVALFTWSNRSSLLMTKTSAKYTVGDCLEVPSIDDNYTESDIIRINNVNKNTYNVSLWYDNQFSLEVTKDISMSGIDLVTRKIECP